MPKEKSTEVVLHTITLPAFINSRVIFNNVAASSIIEALGKIKSSPSVSGSSRSISHKGRKQRSTTGYVISHLLWLLVADEILEKQLELKRVTVSVYANDLAILARRKFPEVLRRTIIEGAPRVFHAGSTSRNYPSQTAHDCKHSNNAFTCIMTVFYPVLCTTRQHRCSSPSYHDKTSIIGLLI